MSNAQPTHHATNEVGQDAATFAVSLTEAFGRDAQNPAVCVADGWGLNIRVNRGHLEVEDGVGRHRRRRRYARATHGLARLVIIGSTGSVSLEALRWCAGVGVAVVIIDPAEATVLSTSGACAVDDGRIRRAQALALGTETGQVVASFLIGAKIAGQADVARNELENPRAADTISGLAQSLEASTSLDEVRQLEAVAANVYWQAWESVALEFIKRDDAKVPSHWRGFEGRRSAVNRGTARHATDPLNALLNLSYRLVEAEGRLATLALGLDPGLGILHADMRNRDGFVLDLIEACRPIADRHIARLVKGHSFRRLDFGEDARGVVRVLPPLTHRLAEAMPAFGAALGPYAEKVAALLGDASPYDMSTPSVLTNAKHKEATRRRSGGLMGSRGVGPGGAGGIAPRKKARQRPPVDPDPTLPSPFVGRVGLQFPWSRTGPPRGGAIARHALVNGGGNSGWGYRASRRLRGTSIGTSKGYVRPIPKVPRFGAKVPMHSNALCKRSGRRRMRGRCSNPHGFWSTSSRALAP